ncbi:MAG: DinB family protein [Dehalococcoidia bacterium]
MNAPLAEMFRYNQWANLTLFEACRTLSSDQLEARPPGISGPVRRLLQHVAGGQQTFALRTRGRQHEGELTGASPWPGFDALIEIVTKSSDDLIVIAEGLDADSEVDLPWMGKVPRFPKSFFMAHAFAHGVEHRTEIKVALAQLGVDTPDLDGWLYAGAKGYGQEV